MGLDSQMQLRIQPAPGACKRLFSPLALAAWGGLDVVGVDHDPFETRLAGDTIKQPLPHPGVAPVIEPVGDGFPVAIGLRQIAPGNTGAQLPQNRVEKQKVIFPLAVALSLHLQYQRSQIHPGFKLQIMTVYIGHRRFSLPSDTHFMADKTSIQGQPPGFPNKDIASLIFHAPVLQGNTIWNLITGQICT